MGQRRHWAAVRYGKEPSKEPFTVNLIAGRQALPIPKVVLTNKGKKTGKTVEETIWFLATDLPLSTAAVAPYAQRCRSSRAFGQRQAVGLEREQTQQPWVLLRNTALGAADRLHSGLAVGGRPRRWSRATAGRRDRQHGTAAGEARIPGVEGDARGLTPWCSRWFWARGRFRRCSPRWQRSRRESGAPAVANRRRETPALRHRTRRPTTHGRAHKCPTPRGGCG